MKKMKLIRKDFELTDKLTLDEFRAIIDDYESEGATHIELSYQEHDYPFIALYAEKDEPKDVPVLFYTIKNKITWSEWCDVVGGNHYALSEGLAPSDNEIFYCTKSQAEELGL